MINSCSRRSAYTLVELTISLAMAGILLAGMSSTVVISLRSADPNSTPATHTLEAVLALSEIGADLQFAVSLDEQNATAITATIPDRNDPDTDPDTIRYAWSGTPGDPLTRQYNAGNVSVFIESVQEFGITYSQPVSAVETVTIWIQCTTNSVTRAETSVPLMNQP